MTTYILNVHVCSLDWSHYLTEKWRSIMLHKC